MHSTVRPHLVPGGRVTDTLHRLAALRPELDRAPLGGLSGRFHSHLTVRLSASEPVDAALEQVARSVAAKVTVIELADLGTRTERDVMLTRYFVDDAAGAVGRIAGLLAEATRAVEAGGWPVVRVKLEHESEPSLAVFDAHRYHEVHIKLDVSEAEHGEALAWLREVGAEHGWVPSRNPRERRAGVVHQFVNLRCYEGDRAQADARVAAAVAALRARGLEVIEVKRETTVLDTRVEHDRWWL